MGSSQRNTRFADYLDLLKVFNERNAEALIVGGQAVNFWAEVFEEQEPELRQYRPFTSSDLDLHRPDLSAKQLLRAQASHTERERDPFGKAFTIVSHTFLIRGAGGNVLSVDDLKMVAGLRPDEVKKGAATVEFASVIIRVLNPIACLKSKLYNLKTLDQRDRQDQKHVRILVPCVRGFLRRMLSEARNENNYRPTLNALKEVLLCTSPAVVIKTARAHGVDLAQILPVADLRASRHPKLARFSSNQLPKWHHLLGASAA